jgi:hypothetical protein
MSDPTPNRFSNEDVAHEGEEDEGVSIAYALGLDDCDAESIDHGSDDGAAAPPRAGFGAIDPEWDFDLDDDEEFDFRIPRGEEEENAAAEASAAAASMKAAQPAARAPHSQVPALPRAPATTPQPTAVNDSDDDNQLEPTAPARLFGAKPSSGSHPPPTGAASPAAPYEMATPRAHETQRCAAPSAAAPDEGDEEEEAQQRQHQLGLAADHAKAHADASQRIDRMNSGAQKSFDDLFRDLLSVRTRFSDTTVELQRENEKLKAEASAVQKQLAKLQKTVDAIRGSRIEELISAEAVSVASKIESLEKQKYVQTHFQATRFIARNADRTQLLRHMAETKGAGLTTAKWGARHGCLHNELNFEQDFGSDTYVHDPVRKHKGTAREVLIASVFKCAHCPGGKWTGFTSNGFTAPKLVIGPNSISVFAAAKYKCKCNKVEMSANDALFREGVAKHPELCFVETCPVEDRGKYAVSLDLGGIIVNSLTMEITMENYNGPQNLQWACVFVL